MNEFLQKQTASQTEPLAADGGLFAAGVALELERERCWLFP